VKGERIRILFLRDLTGESWQLGIPLSLFRFLVLVVVALVILTGGTITWLGSIAVKLQAAEMVSQENVRLRQQLDQVSVLQDELRRIEEREKSLNTLTQSFLDDAPAKNNSAGTKLAANGQFDDAHRQAFLADILADFRKKESLHRAGNDTVRIPLLLPTLSDLQAEPAPGPEPGPGQRKVLAPANTVLRVPLDGIVEQSAWTAERGWHVRIAMVQGWSLELSDLGEIEVHEGDLVRRGDPIGRTQRTGGESSSHFVATLSFHGLAIDPWFAMMR
jgi:murein DD-endopeptidase MepM/ murein hydrolase activator NlpD